MTLSTIKNVSTFRNLNVSNGEINDYSAYDDFLDFEGTVTVLGLEFYPSRILEECDPIAYSCGYNDWVDDAQRELEEAMENGDYSEIEFLEEASELHYNHVSLYFL